MLCSHQSTIQNHISSSQSSNYQSTNQVSSARETSKVVVILSACNALAIATLNLTMVQSCLCCSLLRAMLRVSNDSRRPTVVVVQIVLVQPLKTSNVCDMCIYLTKVMKMTRNGVFFSSSATIRLAHVFAQVCAITFG